ncbi:MAG: hypothetical protein QNK40_14790 [Desulfobacterales bacterium]|nr:hypothetical protein [Desulfobacterales bacterium]
MDFKLTYSRNHRDIQAVSILVGPDSLFLEYRYHQAAKRQEVELTRSSCHYGNKRTWLVCGKCGCKRTALYLGSYGHWACRECLGLVYKVQSLNPHERHTHLAQKIKGKKLKITLGNGVSVLTRPAGMWQTNYMNIVGQIQEHEQLSQQLFMDWFDEIVKKADEYN